MKKISKRDFLKNYLALLSTSLIGGKLLAAESILDNLKQNAPNDFEKELINNPRKQILLAEKVSCPFGPISKMKCMISADG